MKIMEKQAEINAEVSKNSDNGSYEFIALKTECLEVMESTNINILTNHDGNDYSIPQIKKEPDVLDFKPEIREKQDGLPQDEIIAEVSKNSGNGSKANQPIKTECLEVTNHDGNDYSFPGVKKEPEVFDFNTEMYLKEIKPEYVELDNLKKEQHVDNYYSENCITNYEDFKLKNEEICLKQDDENTADGELQTFYAQSSLQGKIRRSRKKSSTANTPRIFSCTLCDFKTKHHNSLYTHSLKHELQPNMYKCPDCDYTTKYKHNIKHHRIIHLDQSQVEMYKCEKCEYKTKRKGHLNSHMRVHLDNPTMHYCDICDYKTKHPGCLKKHVVSHFKLEESNTIYQCKYCDHKTKNKTRLRNHERLHLKPQKCGEFKCYHCTYQINNKYMLIKHLKSHKQKKIKCEYCTFETVRRDKLEGHKKIHVNAK